MATICAVLETFVSVCRFEFSVGKFIGKFGITLLRDTIIQ